MPSTTNALTAKTIGPSPGPGWITPPYRFAGSVTLSAANGSTVRVPLQTIAISSFKYVGTGIEITYGSGNTGNGSDNIAGLTYTTSTGAWSVYTNNGSGVNAKLVSNSTSTPDKAVGASDGWANGTYDSAPQSVGINTQLYIKPAYL
jgi:hypothetical protein